MKNTYKILIFLCSIQMIWSFSACSNYESSPLDWNTEERALNPGDSTENSAIKQLFHACYLDLPNLHNRFSSSYLDAATDDGLPTVTTTGSNDLNNYRNGMLTPGNITGLDGGAWGRNYQGIRRVNLFLEKEPLFPVSTHVPAHLKKRWIAEARLLRAYYYFEMMKRWGGVPIVYDQVLDVQDDCNIARSTVEELANYIISEISPDVAGSCYNDLFQALSSGAVYPAEVGHVNQGVALALLSRMKLYLASPLYNPNGDDVAKWRDAADVAKKLIDLNVYALYSGTPSTMYKLFAMTEVDFPNREMIMLKQSSSSGIGVEQTNSPNGYAFITGSASVVTAQGRTSPSQNLVDAFLTLDGKSIFVDYDPAKGYIPEYDDQKPYANRDPRLDRTIFRNESRWLERNVETFDGGRDRGAVSGAIYTRTGYYLKKFLGNNEERPTYVGLYHHYQIFRYAEILLNYAEAMNECDPGNDAEIISGLIALRKRAGITEGDNGRYGLPEAGTYSQDLMRRIIRNERRIELAFEEHRFWDIRRWKICAEGDGDGVMAKPVRGVRITKNPESGVLTYTYENVTSSKFDGSKMYWYPIPRGELFGNNKLVQNEGWGF